MARQSPCRTPRVRERAIDGATAFSCETLQNLVWHDRGNWSERFIYICLELPPPTLHIVSCFILSPPRPAIDFCFKVVSELAALRAAKIFRHRLAFDLPTNTHQANRCPSSDPHHFSTPSHPSGCNAWSHEIPAPGIFHVLYPPPLSPARIQLCRCPSKNRPFSPIGLYRQVFEPIANVTPI